MGKITQKQNNLILGRNLFGGDFEEPQDVMYLEDTEVKSAPEENDDEEEEE